MRRITMLAVVAVLALAGAACGDDDSGGEDTQSTDEAAVTDDEGGDDGGDDGATGTAAGFLDEDCQFLLAGAYLNPLAALTTGTAADELEETSDQLEAIADDAPDEIKDAMATLAEGYTAIFEAMQDVDFADPQSFTDPEVQEKLDELEDVIDEEYEEAGETVSDYIEENCTLAGE